MKNNSTFYAKRALICILFFTYIFNISCSRTKGYFASYEELIESSYYKGGWIPETVLPKSSYDISIKNDLDVNKVWLTLSYKKPDSIVGILHNSKTENFENIQILFKNYTNEYGKNKMYWNQPTLLYGEAGNNQYYAINMSENKIYYLRTRY